MKRFAPVFAMTTALAVVFGTLAVRAESLPADHPTSALVKKYLTAVVNQDWNTAGEMLALDSLERKQEETVAIIKMAPTMTEEAAMLAKLGAKDLSDLEKMDAREFYKAERAAVHDRMEIDEAVRKRKQETLKIEVLGLAADKDGTLVHATVRTSQETLTQRIEEIFLISLRKEGDKWVIVPDMMRPTTEELTPAEGAAKSE
ncbi:MAG: hypothetical protein KDK99_07835 [Verrucomicrobiales bacterium]|nr:hypothetical protein [Verrucomicrobiales bacterium]